MCLRKSKDNISLCTASNGHINLLALLPILYFLREKVLHQEFLTLWRIWSQRRPHIGRNIWTEEEVPNSLKHGGNIEAGAKHRQNKLMFRVLKSTAVNVATCSSMYIVIAIDSFISIVLKIYIVALANTKFW